MKKEGSWLRSEAYRPVEAYPANLNTHSDLPVLFAFLNCFHMSKASSQVLIIINQSSFENWGWNNLVLENSNASKDLEHHIVLLK